MTSSQKLRLAFSMHEQDLKGVLARLNQSEYVDATKHKFKASLKKFYKYNGITKSLRLEYPG